MRVLVTRSRPDAENTADALVARGHSVVVSPLLIVTMEESSEVNFDGVQAILITSTNGARALARLTARRDVPVFAVGSASAESVRGFGFAEIENAEGDVEALAALVVEHLAPDAGRLVHVAGTVTAGDLSELLYASGFLVERAVAYRADAAAQMPAKIEEGLRGGKLDAALFFSPRTASQFVDLIDRAGLRSECCKVIAAALSPAVAERLAPLKFADVRIAKLPNQESLFLALENGSI
ncbi:MAG TPA: uroporphyrinogen-III synthase [Rhodospirillaceae bacterium]|nr:uroporphyrinogen-III synthase [Rhodospirillaceae bacterium]